MRLNAPFRRPEMEHQERHYQAREKSKQPGMIGIPKSPHDTSHERTTRVWRPSFAAGRQALRS
jgi:hypothetical protein